VLVAVCVFALRGTDPAFAVEGDPVMVRRAGGWIASRSVAFDADVRAPRDGSVLRWIDGGTLRPRAGSVFRITRGDAASSAIRVQFDVGGGDVDGASFVVSMPEEVVVEPSASHATLSFSFRIDAGSPRVEVNAGEAIVRSMRSGERLRVDAAQKAAFLVPRDAAAPPRLALIEAWSRGAETQIARGGLRVVDAGFSPWGRVMFVGSDATCGWRALEVPLGEAQDAVRLVNVASRISTLVRARPAVEGATRYVYEKDRTRVEVVVDPCGGVRVDDGSGPRTYVDLESFRRAEPRAAALFGDALPK
jgi:hypothetical protein